jgi:hypothetical protein
MFGMGVAHITHVLPGCNVSLCIAGGQCLGLIWPVRVDGHEMDQPRQRYLMLCLGLSSEIELQLATTGSLSGAFLSR